MPTCARCSRELRSFSAGEPSTLCPDCLGSQNAAQSTPSESVVRQSRAPNRQPLSLTSIVVGINVAVFATMVLSGVSPVNPNPQQLIEWGSNWGPLSLGPQPWRSLTSNYVHIGIVHIFFNMWCLWNLGRLAERIFDRWTYLLVYTASGTAGSLASMWWRPLTVGAGASGAIFGLAGGLIAVLYMGTLPIPKTALKPILKSLVTFAGYNLLFGLVPGISNAAHLGGLLTGLGLGAVLSKSIAEPPPLRVRWRNYATVGVALLLLAGNSYLRQKTGEAKSTPSPQDPMQAFKHGNFGQAIPGLKQAVERDPGSPQMRYLLGMAYVGAHQPDAAVPSFREALRLKPDYADAEEGLGMAYQAKGMSKESEEAFQKADEFNRNEK
jgi:membrane associated rhomboid family serine protease